MAWPGPPPVEVVYGVSAGNASHNADTYRFMSSMSTRFPFLHPDKIMDKHKHRPGQPDYDPTTLYIPPNWFKDAKVTDLCSAYAPRTYARPMPLGPIPGLCP